MALLGFLRRSDADLAQHPHAMRFRVILDMLALHEQRRRHLQILAHMHTHESFVVLHVVDLAKEVETPVGRHEVPMRWPLFRTEDQPAVRMVFAQGHANRTPVCPPVYQESVLLLRPVVGHPDHVILAIGQLCLPLKHAKVALMIRIRHNPSQPSLVQQQHLWRTQLLFTLGHDLANDDAVPFGRVDRRGQHPTPPDSAYVHTGRRDAPALKVVRHLGDVALRVDRPAIFQGLDLLLFLLPLGTNGLRNLERVQIPDDMRLGCGLLAALRGLRLERQRHLRGRPHADDAGSLTLRQRLRALRHFCHVRLTNVAASAQHGIFRDVLDVPPQLAVLPAELAAALLATLWPFASAADTGDARTDVVPLLQYLKQYDQEAAAADRGSHEDEEDDKDGLRGACEHGAVLPKWAHEAFVVGWQNLLCHVDLDPAEPIVAGRFRGILTEREHTSDWRICRGSGAHLPGQCAAAPQDALDPVRTIPPQPRTCRPTLVDDRAVHGTSLLQREVGVGFAHGLGLALAGAVRVLHVTPPHQHHLRLVHIHALSARGPVEGESLELFQDAERRSCGHGGCDGAARPRRRGGACCDGGCSSGLRCRCYGGICGCRAGHRCRSRCRRCCCRVNNDNLPKANGESPED
mmetsp:Transcript_73671/g.190062  ORF Transcript_73671/g.190062 Transcript_73671/m.190062 type:complete len:633 (-) Transcript_73671:131-2029(-)